MKKTNVSSEVLIFQSYSVKSRPRSKHSSFHMGNTNVSSEVLILPNKLSKNSKKNRTGEPHMCKISKNLHSYKIQSKSSIDKFCSYTHICIKISLVSIIFLSLSLSHSHSLSKLARGWPKIAGLR